MSACNEISGTGCSRTLHILAWANVILHLAGLVAAAVGMRPGSPLVLLGDRLDYLAGAPLAWTLGWVVWMLCAAGLVSFLAVVTCRIGQHTDVARLGLVFAVAGCCFDLFCDCVYILVLPQLAALRRTDEALFLAVERATGIASLVVANGAYALAILLVTLALRRERGLVPGMVAVGYAVAAGGFVLAACGFTGSALHAAVATVPTMLLFCVWVVLVAHSLEPAGGRT